MLGWIVYYLNSEDKMSVKFFCLCLQNRGKTWLGLGFCEVLCFVEVAFERVFGVPLHVLPLDEPFDLLFN